MARSCKALLVGLRPFPDEEKPEVLKAYLDRFKTAVQRYFTVPAGSPPQTFAPVAARYAVFELIPSERECSASQIAPGRWGRRWSSG